VTPIDMSSEAILQLEELKQGLREDAPALHTLFKFLRTPAPAFGDQKSVSMLADVRSYALFRDALPTKQANSVKLTDFERVVEQYLEALEGGVKAKNALKIDAAKRFCLSISDSLIAQQSKELYQRRERVDARYMHYESVL